MLSKIYCHGFLNKKGASFFENLPLNVGFDFNCFNIDNQCI